MNRIARERARQLRKNHGWAIGQIAGELDVAPSTVSLWVRDIVLTAGQRAVLSRHADAGRRYGNAQRQRNALARRVAYQQQGRKLAVEREPLHLIGCMLYWAEGSKTRNCVAIANSDPDLLRLFLTFLRQCYGVTDQRVAFSVNCFTNNGITLEQIEERWLTDWLGLPTFCLRAATVNRPSSAGSASRRTLPYGTGHVRVHSTEIVQSIYGSIQQYAGISRPDWLE